MEIARLEADGTLDPTFTSPFGSDPFGVTVQTLALDGSGGSTSAAPSGLGFAADARQAQADG
jgi:hypothetical protein